MITHRTGNESDSTRVEGRIPCGAVTLEGALVIPPGANGVVVSIGFASTCTSIRKRPAERRFDYHAPEPKL
jgi:hypothetical protein